MSYLTRVAGEIRIDPPLGWAAIQGSRYLPANAWNAHRSVKLRLAEEPVETAEGTLLRRTATAIVAVREERYDAAGIETDVQRLVDAHGPSHSFSGRLDGEGEDGGDLWRLYVRDGRALTVRAQILWPEGDDF